MLSAVVYQQCANRAVGEGEVRGAQLVTTGNLVKLNPTHWIFNLYNL